MILGLLGGLVVLLVIFAFFYAMSLAVTFWFISIPLFIVWFRWIYKREQRRQRNYNLYATPEQKARDQRTLDSFHADNARRAQARAREKAMYKR